MMAPKTAYLLGCAQGGLEFLKVDAEEILAEHPYFASELDRIWKLIEQAFEADGEVEW